MRVETYGTDTNGNTVLLSVEDDGQTLDILSGIADLINGNATVLTSYAGKNVILSRNQSVSSAIGNLYVDLDFTVVGQSFRIRSTNASDNGSVYWEIVE